MKKMDFQECIKHNLNKKGACLANGLSLNAYWVNLYNDRNDSLI